MLTNVFLLHTKYQFFTVCTELDFCLDFIFENDLDRIHTSVRLECAASLVAGKKKVVRFTLGAEQIVEESRPGLVEGERYRRFH